MGIEYANREEQAKKWKAYRVAYYKQYHPWNIGHSGHRQDKAWEARALAIRQEKANQGKVPGETTPGVQMSTRLESPHTAIGRVSTSNKLTDVPRAASANALPPRAKRGSTLLVRKELTREADWHC